MINSNSLQAGVGIGHTRWATHGEPTQTNAHPHIDSNGNLAIIHNGIIENYTVLKKMLEGKGHQFRTETDTEVVAHLIEEFYDGDFEKAFRTALALPLSPVMNLIKFLLPDRVARSLLGWAKTNSSWLPMFLRLFHIPGTFFI